MDVHAVNSLILSLLGLAVFFYLPHTTVGSAIRLGIRDARKDWSKNPAVDSTIHVVDPSGDAEFVKQPL